MTNRSQNSAQYAALITAARRLGYSADEFESAMATFSGPGGRDETPQHWKRMRTEIEREAAKVLTERTSAEDDS